MMLTSNTALANGPIPKAEKKSNNAKPKEEKGDIVCVLGHTAPPGAKLHLVTQGDVSKKWDEKHTIHLCEKHSKELEDIGPSRFIKNYRHELRRNSPAFLSHLRDLEKRPDIPPSDSNSGDTALHNRPD